MDCLDNFSTNLGCLLKIPFNCDAASTIGVPSKAETPAAATKQPRASSSGGDQDATLTIGDAIEQHLQTNRIGNKIIKHIRLFSVKKIHFFKLILNFPTCHFLSVHEEQSLLLSKCKFLFFSNLCLCLRFNRINSIGYEVAIKFHKFSLNKMFFFHLVTNFAPLLQFFKHGKRELMISMLPVYSKCSYSEEDLIQLLTPFGFQHQAENIYVLPQLRMVGPKWSSCLHIVSINCLSNAPSWVNMCLPLQSLLYNASITNSRNSEINFVMHNLLVPIVSTVRWLCVFDLHFRPLSGCQQERRPLRY